MSDEYHAPTEYQATVPTYSPFWPLLVLICGLLVWVIYQDVQANNQRSAFQDAVDKAGPTLQAAKDWHDKYNVLIRDLEETGSKDAAAAPLARVALQAGIQAGLIHVNQKSASDADGTSASPTPTPVAQ